MIEHSPASKNKSGIVSIFVQAIVLGVVLLLAISLFVFALYVLLDRRDAPPDVALTPGIFLPTAVAMHRKLVKFGDRTLIGDGETRFMCAHFAGQRGSYKFIDGAGATASQERNFSLQGVSQRLRLISRSEHEDSLLFYVRAEDGFGTVLVQYWFENYYNMLKSPVIVGAVLYPMMIIFVFSVFVSRRIMEPNARGWIICSEAIFIFLVYVTVLLIVGSYIMDHIQMPWELLFRHNYSSLSKTEGSIGWQGTLLLELVIPIVAIGHGIRLWRRPLSDCIVRIGAFVTAGVVINLSINILAVIALLIGGTVDLRSHVVAIREYTVPLQLIGLEISLGQKPDLTASPVSFLPNWDETCPRWNRFELSLTALRENDLGN